MKSWRKGDPFTTTRRPMQILSPSRVARTTKDYKGTFAHWTWTSKLININSYLSICLSVLNQVFWAKICISRQVVVNESPFLQLSLLFLNVWWMNVLFITLYKTFFFLFSFLRVRSLLGHPWDSTSRSGNIFFLYYMHVCIIGCWNVKVWQWDCQVVDG